MAQLSFVTVLSLWGNKKLLYCDFKRLSFVEFIYCVLPIFYFISVLFLFRSFSFLSNLERLDLGGNELEELPDFIGQLSSLIELWLDNNFLTTFPAEVGELKNLQCLDVSENRVDELPDEIYGLESLTDLILSSNVIHELPEGIGTKVVS